MRVEGSVWNHVCLCACVCVGAPVRVLCVYACAHVCHLVSSDVKEQGEECQKSFGHDGATRHAAIHFESAARWEIQRSQGGMATATRAHSHTHTHRNTPLSTNLILPHRHTKHKIPPCFITQPLATPLDLPGHTHALKKGINTDTLSLYRPAHTDTQGCQEIHTFNAHAHTPDRPCLSHLFSCHPPPSQRFFIEFAVSPLLSSFFPPPAPLRVFRENSWGPD